MCSIRGFAVSMLAFLNTLMRTIETNQVDVLGFSTGGYIAKHPAACARWS